MLRTTILASLLFTACVAEDIETDDSAAISEGKADSFGVVGTEQRVLDEATNPEHVMMDATYVYYTLFTTADEDASPQTRSVMRVRRSTGVAEQIATIIGYPSYAAQGGSFLYFADYEHVFKVPKAGGVPQQVASIEAPNALAADANAVYVAASAHEGDHYFHRISKIANGSTTPVELARATYVTSLAVDTTHLYWLDETQPNPAIGCGRFAGEAHKVNKAGGLDVRLAVGINCPMALAVDGTSLYYSNWAQTESNPVVKLSKYGGFPQVIGRTAGAQIVVDPSYVYWISTAGDLVRTAKTFIVPRTIATGVNHTIAGADLSGVYFWRRQDEPLEYSLYRIGQ